MEKIQQVISTHEFAHVILDKVSNQHSLVAIKPFVSGDVVSLFTAGEMFSEPNDRTVQTANHKHITLVPRYLQYINHSCDPNVFFDTSHMKLICIKPINVGDVIRYFYPSSEWKMAQPFVCNCGAPNCLQLIEGAAFLTSEVVERYLFTDFIKQHWFAKKKY